MAGVDGAQAGIAMLATPRVGDGYLQEQAPGAADRSTVLALDEERTVPAGTFGGLLLTEDTASSPTATSSSCGVRTPRAPAWSRRRTMVGGTERLVLGRASPWP